MNREILKGAAIGFVVSVFGIHFNWSFVEVSIIVIMVVTTSSVVDHLLK